MYFYNDKKKKPLRVQPGDLLIYEIENSLLQCARPSSRRTILWNNGEDKKLIAPRFHREGNFFASRIQ